MSREDRSTEEMCLLTAGQLRGRLDENPHLSEDCYSFMRDICGTQAYWSFECCFEHGIVSDLEVDPQLTV